MQRSAYLVVVVLVALMVFSTFGTIYALNLSSQSQGSSCGESGTRLVQVVAAENFWGSLISQLGGSHVNVTSIVSDPNVDPHEYESNAANAKAITNAQLVVVNGAGYDAWALDIISAENTPNQRVLNVQQVLKQPVTANPHFWYSPYYVNDTVAAMYKNLGCIDPADSTYFRQQYANLNKSLWQDYMHVEATIKQKFAGTPVASTESIFVYMANATGLELVSPPGFMEAVAEGNDPSAQDVATMETLMTGGNSTVHVLVYNEQTVTPLTQTIKALAAQHQISTIGVTETVQPPGTPFQAWMQGEVDSLYNALDAEALGQ